MNALTGTNPTNKALMIGALAAIGYGLHAKYPPRNANARKLLPVLGVIYAVAAYRA